MRKSVLCCAILVLFVSVLSGCLSLSNSPEPRFYTLKAMDKGQVSEKLDIDPGVIVAVGPIDIPDYQDRPQIVTMNKEGMLKFAQLDRWGEPLDSAISRLITGNLTAMLPSANFYVYPCNFAIPVNYQVVVDVIQLDSRLDEDMLLVAQWSVINVKNRKMLLTKRSEFRHSVNPHNYSGLAAALSAFCDSLSKEIAANLAELSKDPNGEKGVPGGDTLTKGGENG